MFNGQVLRKYYIGTLSATAFFMPLSVWLLTFFIITIVLVWIADGGLMRIVDLRKDKISILIFSGTYLVYAVWMIKTSDLSFGLRELKLKLPLLIFPLVIGLSQPLNKKEIKIIRSLSNNNEIDDFLIEKYQLNLQLIKVEDMFPLKKMNLLTVNSDLSLFMLFLLLRGT